MGIHDIKQGKTIINHSLTPINSPSVPSQPSQMSPTVRVITFNRVLLTCNVIIKNLINGVIISVINFTLRQRIQEEAESLIIPITRSKEG